MAINGGCRCGAVRYEAADAPEHHAVCHCGDCRASAGAPMVAWLAFPEQGVSITGTPTTFESSPGVFRQFCGTCGTGLFYRNEAVLPGLVDIQSATLDSPEEHAPGAQIQVAERLGWVERIADLPAFERYPG
ncbi:GFA family protein [Sphingomonas aracearum]|uniref:GFA family protein n=1 Tax=Sphingomonas aracearum TaxID=2283317 RepID=A0A369VVL3_9SPHN|nr:GFA family protein [Sphingomonas aracearum]RDE05102.1 GFA family protein [Sphingomonas aracearum]